MGDAGGHLPTAAICSAQHFALALLQLLDDVFDAARATHKRGQ